MPVYTPLRTLPCRTRMLSRSSKARISFSQKNMSRSCSDVSLNLVRLIGGIDAELSRASLADASHLATSAKSAVVGRHPLAKIERSPAHLFVTLDEIGRA